MAKRWINSLDVEVSESGAPLFGVAGCSSFAGGTKTIASAATPEKLVATSTPCRFVWIGAPCDADGAAVNTKPIFLGDADNQNIPVMTANFEGLVLRIDDAWKLYVKAGADNEGVAYRIFA